MQLLYLIFYACLTKQLSLKVGSSVNDRIQTGEVLLFTDPLDDGIINYYSITFPSPMVTATLEAGVGLVASTFGVEDSWGWSLRVQSASQTAVFVEAVGWSELDFSIIS